jgi:hypothetical protein
MSQNEPLYEISERYKEVMRLADEGGEDMMIAIADTLEGIEGEFQEKAEAIVKVSTNVTAYVAGIDEQIERLQARKKTALNKKEGLRTYLRMNMEATGINKIECLLFKISLSKAPMVLEITDKDDLPVDLIDIETKIIPKKKEIKALLDADEKVAGAILTEGTRRLTIR